MLSSLLQKVLELPSGGYFSRGKVSTQATLSSRMHPGKQKRKHTLSESAWDQDTCSKPISKKKFIQISRASAEHLWAPSQGSLKHSMKYFAPMDTLPLKRSMRLLRNSLKA